MAEARTALSLLILPPTGKTAQGTQWSMMMPSQYSEMWKAERKQRVMPILEKNLMKTPCQNQARTQRIRSLSPLKPVEKTIIGFDGV